MHKNIPGLQASRWQWLHGDCSNATGRHVLYWMQTCIRSRFNHALELAVAEANSLKVPLFVVYTLNDQCAYESSNWKQGSAKNKMELHITPSERQMMFLLESLQSVKEIIANERNLNLTMLKCTKNEQPVDIIRQLSNNAALLVTDHPYLRMDRIQNETLAETITVPIIQVESEVVVPVETASDKEEFAARTIRPKITRLLDKYLVDLPNIRVEKAVESIDLKLPNLQELQVISVDDNLEDVLQTLDVDRTVKAVSGDAGGFHGGEEKAQESLQQFLKRKLEQYSDARNEPAGNGSSNISPYLKYGNISPIDIALQVRKWKGTGPKYASSKASFLEELIIRRELAVNLVWYNKDTYDNYKCLPSYAKITLKEHENDTREHLYSFEELDAAKTGDAYWNAAQLEMIVFGKMNNYMRMYWGKKILEWTQSPEKAFDTSVILNNKYNLDSPDPNSFAGIAWVFGKHDQGWKERPIFGKVRYMNSQGLERKFDMTAYVSKIKAKCKANNLNTTHLKVLPSKPTKGKKRKMFD